MNHNLWLKSRGFLNCTAHGRISAESLLNRGSITKLGRVHRTLRIHKSFGTNATNHSQSSPNPTWHERVGRAALGNPADSIAENALYQSIKKCRFMVPHCAERRISSSNPTISSSILSRSWEQGRKYFNINSFCAFAFCKVRQCRLSARLSLFVHFADHFSLKIKITYCCHLQLRLLARTAHQWSEGN